MTAEIRVGDCLDVLPTLDAASIDAVVTDPPYHLTTGKKGGTGPASLNLASPYGRARIGTGFMGKAWDGGDVAFRAETWDAVLRVAKPGAHLVAFGGTRTFHRLTCAIEDAGWEIRDCLSWLYGSGFPKSHNGPWGGTALKPAWEPIILARKPLGGTVAANHAEHGTGALNVDECRVAGVAGSGVWGSSNASTSGTFQHSPDREEFRSEATAADRRMVGRWPANVALDEEAAAALDAQSGTLQSNSGEPFVRHADKTRNAYGTFKGRPYEDGFYGDSGGASRFFYTSKASSAERNAAGANDHPTVKPLDLMQWLCRLVTPKGGLILDPFTGSGTTGRAAVAEGFRFIGIELSEDYAAIARARIAEYAPLFANGAA